MELIAVKYSWNGKLLCLMLYLFNKYLSINPYSSIDVYSIFICSHMLSFTGKMNENIILGNKSYIKRLIKDNINIPKIEITFIFFKFIMPPINIILLVLVIILEIYTLILRL